MKKIMYIEKRFTFEAAHRLQNKKLDDKQNKETFGKCYNCVSHGHSYKLLVGVSGEIDDNGMIMNFSVLKKLVNGFIIDKVDHKNLDIEVEFLKDKVTTCENMIKIFWEILEQHLKMYNNIENKNVVLKRLQLWEQEDSSVILESE